MPGDQGAVAAEMDLRMRHRGPDAAAERTWPFARLIHRRLSIIDLSPMGLQPMANEDQTVWTVFNGEIYNHRELRRVLESKGHVFKGHADTQVILHLYEECGVAFAEHLKGMFAIAVLDLSRRSLTLVRDRFGIKPLFYAPSNDCLSFASEIRAVRAAPFVDCALEGQAVHDYASLLFVPAPQTIYKGVRALLPGEILEAEWNDHRVIHRIHRYNRWVIAPDASVSETDRVDQVEQRLETAVARQLESDVPLGSLLSGGIDSSLVSAAAQSANPNGIRTSNVKFEDEAYDETWAALKVADRIGSRHETLEMSSIAGTWDHITSLLIHTGQPYADTSLFAANAVFRLMRAHVTVALSGDGGDEGFGGYDSFWRIEDILKWQRIPLWARRGAVAGARVLAGVGVVSDQFAAHLGNLSEVDDPGVLQTLLCWIRPEEHSRLMVPENFLPIRRHFERQWEYQPPRNKSRLEALSALATEVQSRLIMADDYLFKVDTASMRESLEVRVPMLDEDLYAAGLTLPHAMKVRGRLGKRLLRELAARKLPVDVATKRKGGFMIPIDKWVDQEFKQGLRDTLLGTDSALPAYFRTEAYAPVINDFCDGLVSPGISRQGQYQRAIMFLSLHLAAKV